VLDGAIAAAERDAAALLITEFGATIDPVPLERLTDGFDRNLVPWIMWAYNESIVADASQPAGLDNIRSLPALKALVRPHPVAVAGTPTLVDFDPATRVFELAYDTRSPAGPRLPRRLVTVVHVPELHYPDGYAVAVDGARVTSKPCASRLTLRRHPRAREVVVRVTPGGLCPGEGPPPPPFGFGTGPADGPGVSATRAP
jgi:endoglycosylceramidase